MAGRLLSMTPRETSEAILNLPDGELFIQRPTTVSQEQDGACGHWPADVTGADFKALADSHTELLEAAKDLVNAAWQTADHYTEVDELETAIKRAGGCRSFSR